MVKFLFFILLLPSLSFAYPALGDFVHFEAKYEGSVIIMEKKVLTHNIENNTFDVRTLITYKGEIIKDATYTLPYSFLYTPEKIALIMENCYSREGMITDLVISAKKVKACEFYHEDSQLTYMIGTVPFGQVRFQEYLGNGEFLDFNLTYFSSL